MNRTISGLTACFFAANLLLFSSLPPLCPAAKAEEVGLAPPQQVIAKTSEDVREALRRQNYKVDLTQATKIVRDILEPHVNFDRVALFILGKHWRAASAEQRERFKTEFRTLLIRSYTTAFTEYKDWTIRHLPMQWSGSEKTAVVRTEVLQSGSKPVGVAYRMAEEGGEWKAYDLMIEGISLVQNYRTTFSADIERTGSLEGVIRSLTERNAAAARQPASRGN